MTAVTCFVLTGQSWLQVQHAAMRCLDHLLYATPLDEAWASMSGTPPQASNATDGLPDTGASEPAVSGLDRGSLHTMLSHPWPWNSLECPTVQGMRAFLRQALQSAALEVLASGALDAKQADAIGRAASAKLEAAANKLASKSAAGTHAPTSPCTGAGSGDTHLSKEWSRGVAHSQQHFKTELLHQHKMSVAGNGAPVTAAARRKPQTVHSSTGRAVQHSNEKTRRGEKHAEKRDKHAGNSTEPELPAPAVALPTGPAHVYKCTVAGATLNAALLYYQVHRVCCHH